MPSSPSTRSTRGTQLAGPFALVGLVGGALVGSITHEAWVVEIFALVTAFVAGVLGVFISTKRDRAESSETIGTGTVIVGTLAAGTINGTLLVTGFVAFQSIIAVPLALLGGVVSGAIFSLPFMPVLAHIAHADRNVGAARPGTTVDGVQRRGPWAVCLGWIGASILLGAYGRWSVQHVDALLVVAALALVGIALLFVADVRAWFDVRRRERGTDLGVGPLEWIEHPPTGYRAPPKTSLVLRDDTFARAELDRALRRDVLAFVIACAGTGLLIFAAYVHTLPFPL
jgi:hypothetical protein